MKRLRTLDGLQDLRRIGGGLSLHGNPELRSLEALSSVESIATSPRAQYDFYMWNNPKIETLEGLESLKVIGTALNIDDNHNLRSIEALESLEEVGYLSITDNPKLPTCQAEALAEQVGLALDSDSVEIRGNGTGSCE